MGRVVVSGQDRATKTGFSGRGCRRSCKNTRDRGRLCAGREHVLRIHLPPLRQSSPWAPLRAGSSEPPPIDTHRSAGLADVHLFASRRLRIFPGGSSVGARMRRSTVV